MCNHNYVYSENTIICTNCGLETLYFKLDTFNKFSAPINRGYNRATRFKLKVDKLLGFHNGPAAKDPIWECLAKVPHALKTPSCIRKVLRSLKLKNKHYDSVRIFTDCFAEKKVMGETHTLRVALLKMFDEVFYKWVSMKGQNETFFSYDFLLRQFLIIRKSPLYYYCKQTSCKRRNERYLKRFMTILTVDVYGMRSHVPLKVRSLGELDLPKNRRNPQHGAFDLLKIAFEVNRDGTADPSECHVLSQKDSSGTKTGDTST